MVVDGTKAYKGQRVAEKYKARGMVRKLVGKLLDVCVHLSVYGSYLQGLLVNLVWHAQASAS